MPLLATTVQVSFRLTLRIKVQLRKGFLGPAALSFGRGCTSIRKFHVSVYSLLDINWVGQLADSAQFSIGKGVHQQSCSGHIRSNRRKHNGPQRSRGFCQPMWYQQRNHSSHICHCNLRHKISDLVMAYLMALEICTKTCQQAQLLKLEEQKIQKGWLAILPGSGQLWEERS
jgi:hypothetical protein